MEYTHQLDGLKVRYSDYGKGEVLVLLHGFCERYDIFSPLILALSDSYRVLGVDLPGHGGTDLVPGSHQLENVAEWLHRFLTEIGLDKYVLTGHSLGGYIALAYAERFAYRLKGLGLFHSTAAPDDEQRKQSREKTLRFVEKHGKEPFLRSFIPSLFHQDRPEQVQQLLNLSQSTDPEAILAFTEAMRDRRDRRPLLEKLDIPVLFILGRHDSIIPIRNIRDQLVQTRNGVHYVLDHAGHLGMFESPERCEVALRSFMKFATVQNN